MNLFEVFVEDKTFCIVDPELKDYVGHYFEYDMALREVAVLNGFRFLVLANNNIEPSIANILPVERTFKRGVWETLPFLTKIPHYGWRIEGLLANINLFLALRSALPTRRVSQDWVIFSHMVTQRQLLGWVLWLQCFKKPPKIVLLFRFSASWIDCGITHIAFDILKRSRVRDRLFLCTDSDRLAKEHKKLSQLHFQVVPISHTFNCSQRQRNVQQLTDGKLRLVSLGDAREEKGILEILAAVKLLHDQDVLDRFEFVLQVNGASAEILAAIADVKRIGSKNVVFVEKALDSTGYYDLLASSDVVLLPYRGEIYSSRTSGVFTEALAAGKPVIATEDTWMSDQLLYFGSGVTVRSHDTDDLVRAILLLESEYSNFLQRAEERSGLWKNKHNPDELFHALVNEQNDV